MIFGKVNSQQPVEIIDSFRKHDVDGSGNVIWKCNFSIPESFLNFSKSSRLQNVF